MEVDTVRTREQYFALVNGPVLTRRWMLERHLAEAHRGLPSFAVAGFCMACAAPVELVADFAGAWQSPDGTLVPNWRECLRCPRCGLSGRQRRVSELIGATVGARPQGRPFVLYMMEAVSPLHRWVRERFPEIEVIGSEYLGDGLAGGSERNGIRHEDAEHLSLPHGSVDVVVSCDVFEHVNEPMRAFREVGRVLRRGGQAILTFPMDPHLEGNRRRAALVDGRVHHVLPPVYHGNPLSPEGALVFTDFGWQVVGDLETAGLRDPSMQVYWSYEQGYLGIQFSFRATGA